MQKLVSLYLTVIYIAVKNLVKANSRYFVAYAMLDRDCGYFGLLNNAGKITDYLALSKKFIENKTHYKPRVQKYLENNYKEAQTFNDAFSTYRNNIEHFTAITKAYKYVNDYTFSDDLSYFGLYHYVIQRNFFDSYTGVTSEWCQRCQDNVSKFKTYSKDFVKIMNMPFAYNLARYKNLSVDYLFNDLDDKAQTALEAKKNKNSK